MKYVVIGEPCVDVIHRPDESKHYGYGGILYSLISLSVLVPKGDSVFPVMNLGEDEYANIISILNKYPNIDYSGVYKVKHPTRKVNLFYNTYNSGKSARIEHSTDPTYTIPYDSIEQFISGADAILINMISGEDITLETMKQIRSNFRGLIHTDIHNLVMRTNTDGTREHTNLENWREWCTSADTVQMNEFEISSMSRMMKTDYEVAEEILIKLKSNVKGVIVTRGKNGISAFTRKEKSFGGEKFFDLEREEINAIESPHFVDSTGCGDVFASSFLMDFSKNGNFRKSLHFATRIASFNATLSGIDELYKLR